MKRTKNMTYKPTEESRKLFLYATNDGKLYKQMITPVIENMRRKAQKGLYDGEKAVDAFYYIATEASNRYNKDFGYSFNVTDRFTVAVDMVECYEEEIFFELNN